MTGERRYSETEVEEILQRATEQRNALARRDPGEDGLTLSELQEIGSQVGIPPEAMAQAARSLGRPPAVHRTLGLPLTVRHQVPLSRGPRDEEWEHLLADLRETFGARGKARTDGRVREWSNGNLHALVEPTDEGWRLRMGTTKGSARPLLGMGGGLFALGTVLWMMALLGLGDAGDLAESATILLFVGAGFLGGGAAQLPGWARRRKEQMERVGARAAARIEALPPATS